MLLPSRRIIFSILCVGFLFGVFSGSLGNPSEEAIALITVLSLCLIYGVRNFLVVLICVGVTLGGILLAENAYKERSIALEKLSQNSLFGKIYTFTGKVEKELYRTDLSRTFRLKIDNFDTSSTGGKSVDIGLLVDVPVNLRVNIGDTISSRAKLEAVITFPLTGWSGYCWFHRVYGKVFFPTFSRVQKAETGPKGRIDFIEPLLKKGFPKETAGTLLSMIFGNTELLSKDIKNTFNSAGISHILVVSGSNITFFLLLFGFILRFFHSIPLWCKNSILTLFILAYASVVGWDPPVVRATVMGTLSYLALTSGRKIATLNLLLLVACGFLVYSPLSLFFDASFGLSFGATLGIILWSTRLKDLFPKGIPEFFREILGATLSAFLGTLPVIVFFFGKFSLLWIVSNILIAPVLGWILGVGVFYIVVSGLSSGFAYIIGYFIYFPIQYILSVAHTFGGIWMLSPPEWMKPLIILSFLTLFLYEIFGSALKKIPTPNQTN